MNNKREFQMEDLGALWLKIGQNGGQYLSGKVNGVSVMGFVNKENKNEKQPDITLYQIKDGKREQTSFTAFWVNTSKDGKRKYLTGKIGDLKIVGFFVKEGGVNTKRPYISLYESKMMDDTKVKKPATNKAKKATEAEQLPF